MHTDQWLRGALAALACASASLGAGAATLQINNLNEPGVGFNDPTPAAPVGGNTGTTLGEQRLIAFRHAAELWGARLISNVPITVDASFEPLPCSADGATLGGAGNTWSYTDFPGAPRAGTWYPIALRDRIVGNAAQPGGSQIVATFNSEIGKPGCLEDAPFYLGLDGQHDGKVDLVSVLLHEFGHGLGFSLNTTNGLTGTRMQGLPSVWEHFMLDTRSGKGWVQMTDAERRSSARSVDALVWTGEQVTAAVSQVLRQGHGVLDISGPAAGAARGRLAVGEASFGAPLLSAPVTATLMPVVDQPDGRGLACTTLSASNALAVRGNVALVDQGDCDFTQKAEVVQAAGARAMVIVARDAGATPLSPNGWAPEVTIPVVTVTRDDGAVIKQSLRTRSRTGSGVVAALALEGTQFAGADAAGRVKLYAPARYEQGSSVSHFDVSATRNLLMEPAINYDLTQLLLPPDDLTWLLLKDIGW